MTREFDPRRLDVEAFAGEGATLGGDWPLHEFERLAESTLPEPESDPGVAWRAVGEQRDTRGKDAETWLRLYAHTRVHLQCQRCLEPMELPLDVEREFRFVHGEDNAAALDAEDDDHDVLAMTRTLDLHELVEDELILMLPIVPRHDVCPAPLSLPDDTAADAPEAPNPFAALAALKRDRTDD
ncbi:YceD family protein [Piscinibacter koreensis]|uniref:Large ribosomal RNA subunit accumulation protein YceD n=1 Tax=Piscinibacter koreensis TaxID=2742824 RepID=A0A7Y6TXB4_9BURK|nr:YceD family protein [Schlegelella koreensis]NUZ06978.1 DUF177 domain-containing protein [Schlegelella koreensis]